MTTWGEMLDKAYEQGQLDAMKDFFRDKFEAKNPESQAYIVESLRMAGCTCEEIADCTGLTYEEILDITEARL